MSILILVANFGVDTAENGPLKVCQKLARSKKNCQKKRSLERAADEAERPERAEAAGLAEARGVRERRVEDAERAQPRRVRKRGLPRSPSKIGKF